MVKRCVQQQQTFLVIKPTTACVQQELHICFKQECLRSWSSRGLDNAHWRQYHHWTAKSSLSDPLSWQWRNLQGFQHRDPKVQYYLQCVLHLAKACHVTNSTSSTHECWWVQCCHLSRVQFSLCSTSYYRPAYDSCWQAWGQHQWYWLGDFHQWLLNTVDFLCIVLHCAIMLTFALLHYSVLGFCMVTFGESATLQIEWTNWLLTMYQCLYLDISSSIWSFINYQRFYIYIQI